MTSGNAEPEVEEGGGDDGSLAARGPAVQEAPRLQQR